MTTSTAGDNIAESTGSAAAFAASPQPEQPSRRSAPASRQRSRSGQAPLKLVQPRRAHRLPLFVGITAVAILAVLFGFAAFHSQMASTQYEIEGVERELALANERMNQLQIQLDQLNSPAEIERLARGALGMVDPATPVDLVVDESILVEVSDLSASPVGVNAAQFNADARAQAAAVAQSAAGSR